MQLTAAHADADAVRAAVTDLLRQDAPYAAASRGLREEIQAMPSPSETVRRIEETFLGGVRTGTGD
ncbi:hypothetical protein SHKM778_47150 [Streptomyces sp. KM77-8]|uniref:Uncharacterized protein n=1 Tax=Streptomyces haneummycinicus TaxID=3074435 RepID=A0AAT9HLN6_9ACTN